MFETIRETTGEEKTIFGTENQSFRDLGITKSTLCEVWHLRFCQVAAAGYWVLYGFVVFSSRKFDLGRHMVQERVPKFCEL
jgi:hypothetical protein